MMTDALEILEQAKIPAPQARAFVRAVDIGISEVKKTVATKADLAEQFGALRVEIHAKHADAIRWMFLFIVGQTATLLGAGYFLINQLMR
jgi:hypothetical protein